MSIVKKAQRLSGGLAGKIIFEKRTEWPKMKFGHIKLLNVAAHFHSIDRCIHNAMAQERKSNKLAKSHWLIRNQSIH